MRKVFGKGVNDAPYKVTWYEGTKRVMCPFYRKWTGMLERCYCNAYTDRVSAYDNVTVCDEWLTFMNFKSWMEKQDWLNNELDKDLLSGDVKVYSPDTCVFVSREVNTFMTERPNHSGLPYGVSIHGKRYQAGIRKEGKRVHLGLFNTPHEAHSVWLLNKRLIAKELASKQSDVRIIKALLSI